ncbi:MAG: HAD-IC family P-type ATPase [Anaerolineae bacterium]
MPFKGGAYLEEMATIKAIAFDKTGTITTGRSAVTDLVPFDGAEDQLLEAAVGVEARSEHPLAQAVVRYAREHKAVIQEPAEFENVPGQGVIARSGDHTIRIGNERLLEAAGLTVPPPILTRRTELEHEGKTVLIVHHSQLGWLGLIAVADELRPNAAQVIQSLRKAGIEHVVILTGDNRRVADAIAKKVGADEVLSDLLPQDKVDAVKSLLPKYGTVAMVGDGVNDAPALATATIGIAMGAAGTDVALETADVVLMADDLSNIAYAINLSRHARRVVWQNITFALSVIAVLAISTFVISLPLPFGVVGHEGSTLIVVTNGLRLLTYRGR